MIVTASSAMEYAFEGGQLTADASTPAPSVFTSAVVDGLTTGEADKDGDGWVGLTELVGYVTDRVHRVTPNQNPQMWTFGSQGELLIARSRIRRITPAPLAPELSQAMESPLPAARFGVVDYLRERLDDADLGQAYAAWQALHRMVDDDSRKVSEAATEAIAQGVPRVTPAELDLELADGVAVGELRVEGPPIARTAVASSAAGWVRVEQDGATVRVTATPTAPSDRLASVIVEGPTGHCTVPVRLTMPDTESEPPPPPTRTRAQADASAPATRTGADTARFGPRADSGFRRTSEATGTRAASQTTGIRAASERTRPGTTSEGARTGAVVGGRRTDRRRGGPRLPELAGSGVLRYLWKDVDVTGWRVYRTWYDPVIVASVDRGGGERGRALVGTDRARGCGRLRRGPDPGWAGDPRRRHLLRTRPAPGSPRP